MDGKRTVYGESKDHDFQRRLELRDPMPGGHDGYASFLGVERLRGHYKGG